MKKILLTSGCSYTDANYKSHAHLLPDKKRGGWPMWPEIMGQQLNLNVINTAVIGKGNVWISKNIISNIIKYGNQIDTVAVLWTACDRIDRYNSTVHPLIDVYKPGELADFNHKFHGLNELKWPEDIFKGHDVYKTWIRDSLLAMYTVAAVCKSRNIRCIFGQGVSFLLHQMIKISYDIIKSNSDQYDASDVILKNLDIHSESTSKKYQYNISETSFIQMLMFDGIYEDLRKNFSKNFFSKYDIFDSEYAIDSRQEFYLNAKKYKISVPSDLATFDNGINDHHPNAEGQKYIADTFLSQYKIM